MVSSAREMRDCYAMLAGLVAAEQDAQAHAGLKSPHITQVQHEKRVYAARRAG
jgi:hypothetical protein